VRCNTNVFNTRAHVVVIGRDSSVGIATRYGLDSPGFEPGGEEIFCIRPDHSWGPPSLLHNGYRLFLSGVKQSVRDVYYPPPHSAEVKERVELHRHSPPLCSIGICTGSSVPLRGVLGMCLRRNARLMKVAF
jgi:hypothetical protein